MEKQFESLKNPKALTIGKTKFYVSTIPAFYAQRIMLKAGPALAELDVTKIPEDVIVELLSYTAFENENGVPVVLDSVEMVNMNVQNPKDLIALELAEIEENFGFFFDGSLQKVFQPLVDLMQRSSGTSTP